MSDGVDCMFLQAEMERERQVLLMKQERETLTAMEQSRLADIESEVRHLRFARYATRLGIPKRFHRASLAATPTAALDMVEGFLRDDLGAGRCLVLSGPPGVGKTFAAVAALRAAAFRVSECAFEYFPGLCAALMDPQRRRHAMDGATGSGLIVFDDFGTEYSKQGGILEAFIDEIFWYREGNMLATIMTTNLTSEQLKDRLSDRIVDRLRGEWGRIFEIADPSLRGTGAGQ